MRYSDKKHIFAAVAFICAITVSPLHTQAAGIAALLPSAGITLSVDEGKSQKDVKKDVNEKKSGSESKSDVIASILKEAKAPLKDKDSRTGNSSAGEEINISDDVKTALSSSPEGTKEDKKLIIEEEKEEKAKKEEEEGLTSEEKEFSKLVIAKVNDYVNVRNKPDEHEGEIVGKLYDKSVGDFISETNGWYKIKSGNVTGYVKGEYCVTGKEAVELAKKVGTRVAVVNTTTLKVREEPGLDKPVLGLVPIEEELSVVEELDGWVKVDIEEGFGYVSVDYVILRTDFVKAESKEEEAKRLAKEEAARKEARAAARAAESAIKNSGSSSSSSGEKVPAPTISGSGLGVDVVNYAMQFLGNPYKYGGTSLTNGTDCSGFVQSVYKNFGISLPRTSSSDRSVGYDVGGIENAQPGDIVCYSGHVGIYAGNGNLVHASTPKTGITVSNAQYRKILAVRRVLG